MFQKVSPRNRAIAGIMLLMAMLALVSLQTNSQQASAGIRPLGNTGIEKGKPGLAVAAAPVVANPKTGVEVGQSYKNDTSPALRDMPMVAPVEKKRPEGKVADDKGEYRIPIAGHKDAPDAVAQTSF